MSDPENRFRVQGGLILCHILTILGRANILHFADHDVHKPPDLVSQVSSRLSSTRLSDLRGCREHELILISA